MTFADLNVLAVKALRFARLYGGVLPLDLMLELSRAGIDPDKIIELANHPDYREEL